MCFFLPLEVFVENVVFRSTPHSSQNNYGINYICAYCVLHKINNVDFIALILTIIILFNFSLVSENMICARNKAGGEEGPLCKGDSGGPLTVQAYIDRGIEQIYKYLTP